jgi:hypothetical protein
MRSALGACAISTCRSRRKRCGKRFTLRERAGEKIGEFTKGRWIAGASNLIMAACFAVS